MYVTMNPKGYIVMNRVTHQRMKQPKAVNLLFDQANSRIGVQLTPITDEDAFFVGKYGRHGGKVVRGHKLMNDFGIEIKETLQFRDVRIDDHNLLVLDLRTATVADRAKKKKMRE